MPVGRRYSRATSGPHVVRHPSDTRPIFRHSRAPIDARSVPVGAVVHLAGIVAARRASTMPAGTRPALYVYATSLWASVETKETLLCA